MRTIVAIPSKNRPQNIEKFVLPFMSRLNLDFAIFVEPQDYENYKQFPNVVQMPENNKGLGYATMFAKKYAEQNNYDLYF